MNISIIRLKDNNELISIVDGIYEDKLKLIYPHYVRFDNTSNMLGIMPYCPLSDNFKFDIDISRVEFIVEPKKIVKEKYLDMIREDYMSEDYKPDTKIDKTNYKNYMVVEGNNTKH